MPTHWTYESVAPQDALEQGDILRPTQGLRDVFSVVHPHFGDDKYLGFIVETQSCDLVCRSDGLPKALYINIATIRPLSQVLPKIVEHVSSAVSPGVFRASARGVVRQLFERVLNQNEQAQGLFFLYPDADAGVAEPAVAFLRVGIALRREHYEVLRAARVGRLASEFRAKFGWLIGNLFVRPATQDWADSPGGDRRFSELVRQLMEEVSWLDDEIVDAASERRIDIAQTSADALEALRGPTPRERAVKEVEGELRRIAPEFPADLIEKVGNRLRNNGKFLKTLRRS